MQQLWRDAGVDLHAVLQPKLMQASRLPLGMWEYDAQADRCAWEPPTYQLHGLPLGHPVDFDVWASCVHSRDRDTAIRTCREQLCIGEIMSFSYGTATGRRLVLRGKIYRDSTGTAISVAGVALDIAGFERVYHAAVELADMLGADDDDPDDSQQLVRLIRGTLAGVFGEKITNRRSLLLHAM